VTAVLGGPCEAVLGRGGQCGCFFTSVFETVCVHEHILKFILCGCCNDDFMEAIAPLRHDEPKVLFCQACKETEEKYSHECPVRVRTISGPEMEAEPEHGN